jgi:gas vesicle protein
MTSNRYSAFMSGLGIGIGVAMLFTPRSGRGTREKIAAKAADGKDYIKRRGDEIQKSANDLIEAVKRNKENLTEALDAGKRAFFEERKTFLGTAKAS